MEHTTRPENYSTENLWQDSPLTDAERDVFRDVIRQLVLGIKENAHIDVDDPAIGAIDFVSFRDESNISTSVYLRPEELEVKPVGDENFWDEGNEPDADEAHYLRDLGHEWAALEYDIIGELVLMLDLPEISAELSDYLLGGKEHVPCLICTSSNPSQACFSLTSHIPEATQCIYDNAEFELARQLNIPIDGSSK